MACNGIIFMDNLFGFSCLATNSKCVFAGVLLKEFGDSYYCVLSFDEI